MKMTPQLLTTFVVQSPAITYELNMARVDGFLLFLLYLFSRILPWIVCFTTKLLYRVLQFLLNKQLKFREKLMI